MFDVWLFLLQDDELTVSMYHSHIRVDFKNYFINATLLSAQSNLNNGLWHSLSVSLTNNRFVSLSSRTSEHDCTHLCIHTCSLELIVDGVPVQEDFPTFQGQMWVNGHLGVGGIPSSSVPASPVVQESFRGCIRGLSINNQ